MGGVKGTVGSALCWLSWCSTYVLDSHHPIYVSWCQGSVENLHYLGFLTRISDLDGLGWQFQEFLEHVVSMAQSCLCRLYTADIELCPIVMVESLLFKLVHD